MKFPLFCLSTALFALSAAACEQAPTDTSAGSGATAGVGGSDLGGNTGGDNTGGDTSSGGGGGSAATCSAGLACVPISRFASSYFSRGATNCSGASEYDSWPSCDAAACNCAPSDGTCSIDVYLTSDNQCTDLVEQATTPGCYDAPDGDFFVVHSVNDGCDWTQMPPERFEGCSTWPLHAPTCAGGVCVPDAPQQCIITSDSVCPSTIYTERTEVFSGGGDCTCYCSSDGDCASPSVVVSSDDDSCGGTTTTLPLTGSCVAATNVRPIESANVPNTSTACSASSANISGSLGFSLCCMP